MTPFTIGRQFCGPPKSGNGGYVCGVLAREIGGPASARLNARPPLDEPLSFSLDDGVARLVDGAGVLIGQGQAAARDLLTDPPPSPSMVRARDAGTRFVGHAQRTHPICFTCGPERGEGDGLRVFVGPLEGAPEGHVAGVWTPSTAFVDDDGLVRLEVVWAALDCPGFFAWVAKEGRHGALLGSMTAEILRRPRCGEETIVVAWPLERSGRKETAGVALYSAEGELLAQAYQVWITMAAGFPAAAGASDSNSG